MFSKLLFTATEKNGKFVTEKIEAENLSAAKYKLEMQGYTNIEFFDSEQARDVRQLFDKKQIDRLNKQSPAQ